MYHQLGFLMVNWWRLLKIFKQKTWRWYDIPTRTRDVATGQRLAELLHPKYQGKSLNGGRELPWCPFTSGNWLVTSSRKAESSYLIHLIYLHNIYIQHIIIYIYIQWYGIVSIGDRGEYICTTDEGTVTQWSNDGNGHGISAQLGIVGSHGAPYDDGYVSTYPSPDPRYPSWVSRLPLSHFWPPWRKEKKWVFPDQTRWFHDASCTNNMCSSNR